MGQGLPCNHVIESRHEENHSTNFDDNLDADRVAIRRLRRFVRWSLHVQMEGAVRSKLYTYDFRSDRTCVFTPYVSAYGGIVTQGDVERDAVTVDDRPIHAAWRSEVNENNRDI